MSIQALNFVMEIVCEDKDISSTQRLILFTLANYSNPEEKFECSVSLNTLALKTGLHKMTVQKNLESLCKTNYLKKTEHYDENGRRKTNSYALIPVEVGVSPEHTPVSGEHTPIYYIYNYNSKTKEYIQDISNINKNNNITDISLYKRNTDIKDISNISLVDFDKLWKHYPPSRRGDKKQAKKKYGILKKTLTDQQIYLATKNYVTSHQEQKGEDYTYLKLLSTFLNNDLLVWLSPDQHPEGEFNINFFRKSSVPKKYIGNTSNLNPEYVIWEAQQEMEKIHGTRRETTTDQSNGITTV